MTSSVITFDKITAKRTLAGRVNLAREVFLRRGEAFDPAQIVAELGMPLFVKPNANGSSFGVTKVHARRSFPQPSKRHSPRATKFLIEVCHGPRNGLRYARRRRQGAFSRSRRSFRRRISSTTAKYTAGFSDEITPADITPGGEGSS